VKFLLYFAIFQHNLEIIFLWLFAEIDKIVKWIEINLCCVRLVYSNNGSKKFGSKIFGFLLLPYVVLLKPENKRKKKCKFVILIVSKRLKKEKN
jgi:hypothetical protein